MQLLVEHATLETPKDLKISNMMKMNNLIRDVSSHKLEAKDKASNASLLLMNPVASGDNVVTGLSSTHKMKEELPPLVPCCEGRELKISEDLVRSGLSAISVKHDGVMHCVSMSCASEKMQVLPGLVKHRNSFRSLHRPDLKRVPYLRRMTPDELESLFLGFADIPILSANKDMPEQATKITDNVTGMRDVKDNKITLKRDDDNNSVLKPIPETRSAVEDVPVGKRLHGATARVYTSVPGGAKTGDCVHNPTSCEEYDAMVLDDPEDEIQLKEELQIIMPPRCDDVTESMTSRDRVVC